MGIILVAKPQKTATIYEKHRGPKGPMDVNWQEYQQERRRLTARLHGLFFITVDFFEDRFDAGVRVIPFHFAIASVETL